jgi:hyaluronan synthase
MTVIEIPQAELELKEKAETADKEDLYHHSKQRISENGRISVSKKAWVIRGLLFSALAAFMVFNIMYALTIGDPLIVYSTLMPIQTLIILVTGWFLFKNKATGKVPDELVSVIIPVYNQENLIENVVRAISASTYTNLEIVAVNDGSMDRTGAVLDYLTENNPRLRVIHKPNGGKRTAVAAGFYASKGKLVVLIDSDSIIDKYAIEEITKVFSANPKVGGVVANGKVLNADKNLLTKCQDAWYDYSFNLGKTTESTFGTVLCLSGCMAAYRRETIAHFIPLWANSKFHFGDDRHLTTYAIAASWAKKELAPMEKRFLTQMASYDDSEDRGLTAQAIAKEWQTVYAPTAVVYTDVPETMQTYLRQQTRWKKGYFRSTFFISGFFWRKNPVMALLFYLEFMSAFLAPAITFSVFIYGPLFLHSYLFPLTYLAGQLLIGLAMGLDYKFRDPTAKNWKYKPLMNLISAFILPWVLFPAFWGFRKNGWLTR